MLLIWEHRKIWKLLGRVHHTKGVLLLGILPHLQSLNELLLMQVNLICDPLANRDVVPGYTFLGLLLFDLSLQVL